MFCREPAELTDRGKAHTVPAFLGNWDRAGPVPKPTIGVISNPGSTRMRREISRFRKTVAAYPEIDHREIRSIEDLSDILKDFAAREVDLVLINGGDGTVQAVISQVIYERPFEKMPVFAALPGGKTNMTAEALGAFDTASNHVDDLMEDLGAGKKMIWRELPFVRMQISPDTRPIYGTFFGTATLVRGIYFVRKNIYPLGLPNFLSHMIAFFYLSLVAISPFKTRRSPMRREKIRVDMGDNKVESRAYLILLVTTLDTLILGLRTASNVGEGPLRLTAIDYTAGAVFRAARTLLFGRSRMKMVKGLMRRKTAEVLIETTGPVTLDGEMFQPIEGVPVRLSASQPFRFLVFES
ncbi:MAG: diacylglycerol kinase family protein [Alphaproteobacteria bacterium]|nr:diacylglycerol kinase family protein [Alphaproteobacteria bacterium]